MEIRKGYVVNAPANKGEMGVIGLEMKNDLPGKLELYCVSGGPVFLFQGKMTGSDLYPWIHGGSLNNPLRFEALAVASVYHPGVCIINGQPGPITVASDVESIGLVRICEISK